MQMRLVRRSISSKERKGKERNIGAENVFKATSNLADDHEMHSGKS